MIYRFITPSILWLMFLFFQHFILLSKLHSQRKLSQGKFVLQGKILDAPNEYIHLNYVRNGEQFHDSAFSKRGKFKFKGVVDEPSMALVYLEQTPSTSKDSNSITLFLEPSKMRTVLRKNKFKDAEFGGSTSQTQFSGFVNDEESIASKWAPLLEGLENAKLKRDRKSYDSIRRLLMPYQAEKDSMRYTFIKNHPNSYVSSYVLTLLNVNADSLNLFIGHLSPEVQASRNVIKIKQAIARAEMGAAYLGNKAPEFSLNDVFGNNVSLNDFRDKYVLIDFWASWCKPCRDENANLVEIYEKYNQKNFTILGISLDDYEAKDAWKKAITKDGLKWPQLSDLKGRQSFVTQLYNVQEIPFNLLVDPKGIIVAVNLHGAGLENELKKHLK